MLEECTARRIFERGISDLSNKGFRARVKNVFHSSWIPVNCTWRPDRTQPFGFLKLDRGMKTHYDYDRPMVFRKWRMVLLKRNGIKSIFRIWKEFYIAEGNYRGEWISFYECFMSLCSNCIYKRIYTKFHV